MFTFSNNVLDPTKYNPNLLGPTLSSTGVEFLSAGSLFASAQVVLQQADTTTIGVAFNRQTNNYATLTAIPALINTDINIVSFALDTTVIRIPKALNNTVMTLIKQPSPSNLRYVTFTFLSAAASTAFVSLCTLDQNVSTRHDRRLRHLGYNA